MTEFSFLEEKALLKMLILRFFFL